MNRRNEQPPFEPTDEEIAAAGSRAEAIARLHGNRPKMSSYLTQQRAGAVTLGTYLHYAIEIGCRVEGEEIEATPEQTKLLDAMWQKLTASKT